MKTLYALVALLLASSSAGAEQAMTAGKLLAGGFQVRGVYHVDKGAPVLVLQNGTDVFLCALMLSDPYLTFSYAGAAKEPRSLSPMPTVCAQIK